MQIDSFRQKIRIASIEEAIGLGPAERASWNILSIRGRMNELPLTFPGARRVKTLHVDDVEADDPGDGLLVARPEDIQNAIAFAREIGEEPLLIHCYAGISRSTAMAWIVIYDKLKSNPDGVRRSFDIVRKLRPILLPNRHILRLGVEALVPKGTRTKIMQEVQRCLVELRYPEPFLFPADR